MSDEILEQAASWRANDTGVAIATVVAANDDEHDCVAVSAFVVRHVLVIFSAATRVLVRIVFRFVVVVLVAVELGKRYRWSWWQRRVCGTSDQAAAAAGTR